jgi:hypothetical protein
VAIGGAVVYRTSQSDAPPQGDYLIASMSIPQGAEVVSAVSANGQVTLTYRHGPMTSVRIIDGKTGQMVREIPVVSE